MSFGELLGGPNYEELYEVYINRFLILWLMFQIYISLNMVINLCLKYLIRKEESLDGMFPKENRKTILRDHWYDITGNLCGILVFTNVLFSLYTGLVAFRLDFLLLGGFLWLNICSFIVFILYKAETM